MPGISKTGRPSPTTADTDETPSQSPVDAVLDSLAQAGLELLRLQGAVTGRSVPARRGRTPTAANRDRD